MVVTPLDFRPVSWPVTERSHHQNHKNLWDNGGHSLMSTSAIVNLEITHGQFIRQNPDLEIECAVKKQSVFGFESWRHLVITVIWMLPVLEIEWLALWCAPRRDIFKADRCISTLSWAHRESKAVFRPSESEFSLMCAIYSLIFFTCSLIFFAFAPTFAWCEYSLTIVKRHPQRNLIQINENQVWSFVSYLFFFILIWKKWSI